MSIILRYVNRVARDESHRVTPMKLVACDTALSVMVYVLNIKVNNDFV